MMRGYHKEPNCSWFNYKTLLCDLCLNPTIHEYQLSVTSDLIYMYIFILTILRYYTNRNGKNSSEIK